MMKPVHAAQPSATTPGALYEMELAAALTAHERDDEEALHDFRVALRRLDVLVKHLAQQTAQRNMVLREIRKLMRQSNKGRDVQVMLGWLKTEWPYLETRERIGAQQWQRKLEHALRDHRLEPKQISSALKRMMYLLTKLSSRDTPGHQPFGLLAAQCLEQQASELISLLKGDKGAEERLHLIRLKAKTVRYLLLPLGDESPACTKAEEALRRLQTMLGDWHDTVLRQQSLNDTLRKVIIGWKDTTGREVRLPAALPGLITLARINTLAQQQLVVRIKRKYLRGDGSQLAMLLQQAIAAMRKVATTAHG